METSAVRLSYVERLQTFKDSYWEDDMPTAKQLAALGHVSDRPPLESLEEGSRCIDCAAFMAKDVSIGFLDHPVDDKYFLRAVTRDFHHHQCVRIAIRLPTIHMSNRGSLSLARYRLIKHETQHEFEDLNTSPLYRLPAEIRLHIYAYVLPVISPRLLIETDSAIDNARRPGLDEDDVWEPPTESYPDPNVLAILRTCRWMNDEALAELYNKTVFEFLWTGRLYSFLRRIGRRGRRHLRHVRTACCQRGDAPAFALLSCCERLATITIVLPQPTLMSPNPSLWLAEGITALLDISGVEHVETCFGSRCNVASHDETPGDEEVLRRELTRPRGTPGNIRFINGVPDV